MRFIRVPKSSFVHIGALLSNFLALLRNEVSRVLLFKFLENHPNGHVNNLLMSSTKDVEEWTIINIDNGKWSNNQSVDGICGPEWYGWPNIGK